MIYTGGICKRQQVKYDIFREVDGFDIFWVLKVNGESMSAFELLLQVPARRVLKTLCPGLSDETYRLLRADTAMTGAFVDALVAHTSLWLPGEGMSMAQISSVDRCLIEEALLWAIRDVDSGLRDVLPHYKALLVRVREFLEGERVAPSYERLRTALPEAVWLDPGESFMTQNESQSFALPLDGLRREFTARAIMAGVYHGFTWSSVELRHDSSGWPVVSKGLLLQDAAELADDERASLVISNHALSDLQAEWPAHHNLVIRLEKGGETRVVLARNHEIEQAAGGLQGWSDEVWSRQGLRDHLRDYNIVMDCLQDIKGELRVLTQRRPSQTARILDFEDAGFAPYE